MLNELVSVNSKFVEIMEQQEGVLGAWYFGSVAHDTADGYSDIDIVFLADENSFGRIDERLDSLLSEACDEIVLRWDENFNSDAIKCYGYLLRYGGKLFLYDVFLLNQGKIDDFMCRIHYTDLKPCDVIFDKNGSVQALIAKAVTGSRWHADIRRLVMTYWFHVHMSAKYFARQDFFKLEGISRTLMDTHASLLLSAYDRITWGGSANKLNYIPAEKQEHLLLYGCVRDFALVRENMDKSMRWFDEDVREIGNDEIRAYSARLAEAIIPDWQEQTKFLADGRACGT